MKYEEDNNSGQSVSTPITSTYRDVYKYCKPIVEKKDCCSSPPDPLLNRIPKNDFEILPSSTFKFMDDHLVQLSEGRKKINFFRQMRFDEGQIVGINFYFLIFFS